MDNELHNPEAGKDNELKEEELKEATGGRTSVPGAPKCPRCHSGKDVVMSYKKFLFYCEKCHEGFNGF